MCVDTRVNFVDKLILFLRKYLFTGYHYRLNISGLTNIVGKIFVTLKGTKGESQVANVVG